jgi:glyoxylase-like metal-dependent hydrolase (beta-lactamase superfamily II)
MIGKPLKVGALEIFSVSDGHFAIPEPPQIKTLNPDLSFHRDYIPGDGTFITQLGAFLVRTGGRMVLLDAGLGPPCGHEGTYCGAHADPKLLNAFDDMWRRFGRDEEFVAMRRQGLARTVIHHGLLERSLRTLGVAPEEVTDVVLSHLHCDHMGWVTRDEKPFFSNATVWVHEADAAHFLGDNAPDETGTKVMFGVDSAKKRLSPALGQFRTWRHDTTIAPGIDVRHTPGHTPGSSIAIVSSQGQRAMMLGDAIHCPLEMTDVAFSLMADFDKALAHRTKMSIIKEVEDGSTHVASPHFPGMQFGRLLQADGKRHFTYSG